MRKALIILIFIHVSLYQYGQIIADHTVVDKFDEIPQFYIDKVKEMWLLVPGESHAFGYRNGLYELETLNPLFDVNLTYSGVPESYTKTHLRVSSGTWGDYSNNTGWIYSYGEEDFFTNGTALSRTKAGLKYCADNNLTVSAFGFAWCWDDTGGSASAAVDSKYGVHWYGQSVGGPEGNLPWGLDSEDMSLTGNSVCMDTYLNAVEEYISYCKLNSINTKVFFTTGPVDPENYIGEAGYQGSLKHQYIRDYVSKDATRILFDYADILCYDDDGTRATTTWNGHTYPLITSKNLGSADIGHIGAAGRLRLAKAMWWMLARIAGWDGSVSD